MKKSQPSENSRAKVRRSGLSVVGLIVEGETEFYAIPQLHTKKLVAGCPPLRAINLGGVGSHLNPKGVARKLAPRVLEHYAAGRRKVVACIDREQRSDCPGAFAEEVCRETLAVVAKKAPELDLHIVVADRAFEAWILAGATELTARGVFKKVFKIHCFEGLLGERQRKGCLELEDLLGRPYEKVRDGPRLFAQLDFAAARQYKHPRRGSHSLDKLLRTLGI